MGINERLQKIEEKIGTSEPVSIKNKKWRLTWKAKCGKNKQKKNYIGILKINENGSIEASKQRIEEQTVMVDGVPRLATAEHVLRWVHGRKSFPVIILPSWSVDSLNPSGSFFKPSENKEESLENGSNIAGYKLLLNRMKLTQVEQKKQLGGMLKWIIIIGLVAVIGYAVISSGGI